MTFSQSRAISQAGLHVRRSAWSSDKWLMLWRGTWFCFAGGNPPHPVRAADYGRDDLLATDWTTMPAALAACPVDPTIGSTGGGSPVPGTGGFPADPVPASFGGIALPPPDPGLKPPPPPALVTVTFAGILSPDSGGYTGVNLNQIFTFHGPDYALQTFQSGQDASSVPISWDVTLSPVGGKWTTAITAHLTGNPSGGFKTDAAQPIGTPIQNWFIASGGTYAYAGTATIAAG